MSSTQQRAAAAPGKPRFRDVLASPKMLAILFLGAASGFPNQITESAMQGWLKDFNISNTTIGLLTYVSLPYLLKPLWAPLLDRYPLPLLDRRRGWILALQLLLAVAIAVFAFQNPATALVPLAVCALVIVFLSASQDIVIDAYRTDISLPPERGLAAAANNLGYRAAAWLAFAFAFAASDQIGWRNALLSLAGFMVLFAVATWFAPRLEQRTATPRTLAESIVSPLRELLGTKDALALIGLIVLFKVGDAFALKLFTPFMMDVGFSKEEIAFVAKVFITSGSILGAVLGGLWMVKLGLVRSMLLFGVLQTASNLAYYVLAIVGPNHGLMIVGVLLDNLAGGMGNVALVALIMAMCDPRFSAFQYALLSAVALTPRYLLGGPAGWIADHGGWDTYYVVSVIIAVPGLLLVWLMRARIQARDATPESRA